MPQAEAPTPEQTVTRSTRWLLALLALSLLGTAFGKVKGKDGVTGSKLAMGKFLAMQANVQAFTLTIRNPEPTD